MLRYFDTITHSPMALQYLIEGFDAEHVLLDSDCPYDMGDPEPVTWLYAAGLDAAQFDQIACANVCKLLGIGV
jgi:aminocarboxymuconate-semialdehyde decarboxylase